MSSSKSNKGKGGAKPAQAKTTAVKPTAPANKIDAAETAKIAGILTAICLLIALALAGTNLLTKDIIAEAALEAKAATCRNVIPAYEYIYISDEFEGFDNLDVYLAVVGGRVSGAAITTSSKGYGGAVQVMTGVDENGRVTGVSVLQHSETAGLGANAAKPKFLDQFVLPEDQPNPESYAITKDGGEIDAVTAASISSRAVTASVNEAVEIFGLLKSAGIIGTQLYDSAPSATDVPAVTPTDVPEIPADETGGAVNE